MRSTPADQSHAQQRDDAHRHAQAQAIEWADRATAEYGQAVHYEDNARRSSASAYLRDAAAEERRRAQVHGVRSAEALKLAEMWAAVSRALA
ncbi:hypothetical protein AB0M23_31000 [Streptomyces sp. NPDC052077]|uniref:hypothetical protein n=1 Tax=Streptomyces sp. NPDC052077 TaxID=3154757 RepID=UPI0034229D64